MSNFILLMKKDIKTLIRGGYSLKGLCIYSLLFTLLYCFLLRELKVSPDELALVSFPGLWLVFLFLAFRLSLVLFKIESQKEIFLRLLDAGFSSEVIMYSKLLFGTFVFTILFSLNYFTFVFFVGYPEVLARFVESYFVFLLSVPGLLTLSYIGALVSQISNQEEIIMGVSVVPCSLYYGVLIVNEAGSVFQGMDFSLSSAGVLIYLGFGVVLALVSPLLIRFIFNSSRVY